MAGEERDRRTGGRRRVGASAWLFVLAGVAVGALASSTVANRRISALQDAIAALDTEAGRAPDAKPAPPSPPPPRLTAGGDTASLAGHEHRMQDLERRLALVMTLVEGEISSAHRKHDAERRRLAADVTRLRSVVRDLSANAAAPQTPDAGPRYEDVGVAEEDGDDAGAAPSEAAEVEPGEGAAPLRRDELLQAIREESIAAEVTGFAVAAGLSDAQTEELEQIIGDHRGHHLRVIDEVRRGERSVRDAGTDLRLANERRDKALRELLSADQLQRFQTTMGRLDELWWRY